MPSLTRDEKGIIADELRRGNKITAIQYVMNWTGCNLVTAKGYVDSFIPAPEPALEKPKEKEKMTTELFIVLYKWVEVDEDDYDDISDIGEWKLMTDANKECGSDIYLYPHALVRQMCKNDEENYGVKEKPFFAVYYEANSDDDPYEEEYFATKEEAFKWCEQSFGLTKVGG